jgi:hypothetical protein
MGQKPTGTLVRRRRYDQSGSIPNAPAAGSFVAPLIGLQLDHALAQSPCMCAAPTNDFLMV